MVANRSERGSALGESRLSVPPLGDQARCTYDKFEISISEDQRLEFYRRGWWRSRTAWEDFAEAARRLPDKVAVVTYISESGQSHTLRFGEMSRLVERVAGAFVGRGVEPCDVVTVQLPNWWQFTVVAMATFRIGAVLNPIIPAHRSRDVRFITGLVDSKVCVVPETFRGFNYVEMIREVAPGVPIISIGGGNSSDVISFEREVLGRDWELDQKVHLDQCVPDPDQVAEILFTSGTTGEPKGVGHTHNTEFARSRAIWEILGLGEDDVVFMPSTVGHSTGLIYGCVTPLMLGMKAVYQDVWDPDLALEVIERERATWSFVTTTFVVDLIRSQRRRPRDLSSLRYLVCGGAAIPPTVVVEAWEILSARVMAVWGMTENGAVTCTHPNEPRLAAAESDGLVAPWMELQIDDPAITAERTSDTVGELKVRGASQMLGYVRRPELTAAAFDDKGWFATGDLARIETDGHLRIVGRTKDLILRGGENIPVVDVEAVLYAHPLLQDVAVVAVPDSRLGERACLVVVPEDGATVTLEAVNGFLEQAGVAKVYWPEYLKVVQAMPYNALGKIQKYKLREWVVESQRSGQLETHEPERNSGR